MSTSELQSRIANARGFTTQGGRRPKRVPLQGADVLRTPTRDGFTRRWTNIDGNKIERRIENGWLAIDGNSKKAGAVKLDTGKTRVGDSDPLGTPLTKNVGGGMTAVLMEKPTEDYVADQVAKQKLLDKADAVANPAMNDEQRREIQADGTYGYTT